TLLKANKKVFVIGHSHGGNVIASAIQSEYSGWHFHPAGIEGSATDLMVITVGTPFLTSTSIAKRNRLSSAIWLVFVLTAFLTTVMQETSVLDVIAPVLGLNVLNSIPRFLSGLMISLVFLLVLLSAALLSLWRTSSRWEKTASPSYIANNRFVAIFDQ